MEKAISNKLYENVAFQNFAEDILRPGGLELTSEAINLARLVKGSKILDLGCGCGKSVEFLQNDYDIIGIDSSLELINKTKSKIPNLRVEHGSAYDLPYQDSSMDGILAECVMSLLDNKEVALSEAKRVMKPKGKLIVSDLYIRESNKHFTGLPLVTCINGMKTEYEVIAEMRLNGFELVNWQDKTLMFKGFLAGLIMNYGSMALFWQSLVGDCGTACEIQESLKGIKIGYYLAIWQKK